MLDMFREIGLLPLWICSGIVCLCLVGAWFRKSRRAAGAALTIIWIAGMFYVPFFLWEYARFSQAEEAQRAGAELDPDDLHHFHEVTRAAWSYGALLSVTCATFVLFKPRRAPPKRKRNLQVEYLKAIEVKRAKEAAAAAAKEANDAANDEERPEGGAPG